MKKFLLIIIIIVLFITYIPNTELATKYAAASVVLNDHWPSMKDFGYISNRVFDVTASGGVLVSDHIPGIQKVFDGAVHTFHSAEDFSSVLEESVAVSEDVDKHLGHISITGGIDRIP